MVPENIHTPPTEDHRNSEGEGGLKALNFQGVRGLHEQFTFRLRKDNIGLREVTSSGYSSEQPRTEIRLYRKLTCIHSLSVVMADDVGEIKTSNVC